jgi:hypothetical protein
MTQRDHLPPQARAFFARDKAWCLARSANVGPRCAELVERLLADLSSACFIQRCTASRVTLPIARPVQLRRNGRHPISAGRVGGDRPVSTAPENCSWSKAPLGPPTQRSFGTA